MGTQANESSFAGKANLTVDPRAAGNLLFHTEASETKTMLFADPSTPKGVFISTAGATDFSIRASRDSLDAHSKGLAVFAAAALYSNRDGNLFLGDFPAGVTAIEVTCLKKVGSAADSASEITNIGGRVEVRAVVLDAVTSGEEAHVPMALTELAVDP